MVTLYSSICIILKIIFPLQFTLSLDNIKTFKLMNLQNTLNDLAENACLKNSNIGLHPCEVGQIFFTLGVYISKNIIFKITQIEEYKIFMDKNLSK